MRAEDPRQISPTPLDGPIGGTMSFRSRATLTGHAERNGSAEGCPAIPMCTYLAVSVAWALEDPDYVRWPGVVYHRRVKLGTKTGAVRPEARARELFPSNGSTIISERQK
ncbi:hypothetical protein AWV80_26810 [Cupriavidus sp. UYMU48A]|nr:hypothetical protein AWV80_26810 [Cupriavidus sp. UYMU48A]